MRSLIIKDFEKFPDSHWGFRKVNFSDPKLMRLFLLSLLWRAAATDREDFNEIEIST